MNAKKAGTWRKWNAIPDPRPNYRPPEADDEPPLPTYASRASTVRAL